VPLTPIYGLPFEHEDDQPLHSLTGGSSGTEPILAEEVEDELARIEGDIADVESDLAGQLAQADQVYVEPDVNVASADGDKELAASVTVTVGPQGIAHISVSCLVDLTPATGTNIPRIWVRLSGANTADTEPWRVRAGDHQTGNFSAEFSRVLAGLTAGATTFTLFASMTTNNFDIMNQQLGVVCH
jgi:hypothetical protein